MFAADTDPSQRATPKRLLVAANNSKMRDMMVALRLNCTTFRWTSKQTIQLADYFIIIFCFQRAFSKMLIFQLNVIAARSLLKLLQLNVKNIGWRMM